MCHGVISEAMDAESFLEILRNALAGTGSIVCLSVSMALGPIPRSSLSHKKIIAAVAGGTGCATANLEIEASLKQPKQP